LALGLAIGAGWALACPAAAQDPAGRPLPPSIRVMGQATVSARPDQAQINIGVVTQAPAAQEASAQNARQTDAVLAELRRTLGAGADIRTASYAISPNYRYPREGGQPTITGYTATNVVQVKTDRLADVGKVIDVATASGANTIQGLQFTLKDEAAARLKALGDAAVKARTQAQALATALGLKIVRVLSVVEGEPTVVHPMRVEALAARAGPAAPTPVEPGTIDIRATVTLTVEVSP
jgi:hypothetical protein